MKMDLQTMWFLNTIWICFQFLIGLIQDVLIWYEYIGTAAYNSLYESNKHQLLYSTVLHQD